MIIVGNGERRGSGVASIPLKKLIGSASVIDLSADAEKNPNFLLEVGHVKAWEMEHGQLKENTWLLFAPAGTSIPRTKPAFSSPTRRGHTYLRCGEHRSTNRVADGESDHRPHLDELGTRPQYAGLQYGQHSEHPRSLGCSAIVVHVHLSAPSGASRSCRPTPSALCRSAPD